MKEKAIIFFGFIGIILIGMLMLAGVDRFLNKKPSNEIPCRIFYVKADNSVNLQCGQR